tara:strand:- start:394 stop:546 length:153 start_codon:yes stop_codon:yes gene_type:complete
VGLQCKLESEPVCDFNSDIYISSIAITAFRDKVRYVKKLENEKLSMREMD